MADVAPAAAPRQTAPAPVPGAGALQSQNMELWLAQMDRHAQRALDRIAPFQLYRWVSLLVLMSLFILRIFIIEGFYIVVYVLFIYQLNSLILFLQPKDRASLVAAAAASADAPESAPALPTMDDDEFRPFVRRLPEFKFWYSATYATILAFCATFFSAFDVPVFWPVLVFYFIMLFIATMRRQWLDMKRFKYVPWDIGNKKTYKSDPKKLSVKPTAARAAMDANTAATSSSRGANLAPIPTVNLSAKKAAAGSAPSPASSAAPSSNASQRQ